MTTTAIACLASAAIAAAGAWAYQGHRYDAQLSDVRREYLQRDFTALEAQYADTIRLQKKADDAQAKATVRIRTLAADRDTIRGAVERLRGDLTALPACHGASTSDHAGVVHTDPVQDVLSECAGVVADLAAKADGHASDVMMLREAWPR